MGLELQRGRGQFTGNVKSKDLYTNICHIVWLYILDIKVIFGNSTLPGKEFLVKFS